MADNQHLVEFEKSLSKSSDYPLNLTRTVDFSHTLHAYKAKLVQDEELYFDDSQPHIRTWDLVNPQDGPCYMCKPSYLLIILVGSHVSRSSVDLDQLQTALGETPTDPWRRFMCVQKKSS